MMNQEEYMEICGIARDAVRALHEIAGAINEVAATVGDLADAVREHAPNGDIEGGIDG